LGGLRLGNLVGDEEKFGNGARYAHGQVTIRFTFETTPHWVTARLCAWALGHHGAAPRLAHRDGKYAATARILRRGETPCLWRRLAGGLANTQSAEDTMAPAQTSRELRPSTNRVQTSHQRAVIRLGGGPGCRAAEESRSSVTASMVIEGRGQRHLAEVMARLGRGARSKREKRWAFKHVRTATLNEKSAKELFH